MSNSTSGRESGEGFGIDAYAATFCGDSPGTVGAYVIDMILGVSVAHAVSHEPHWVTEDTGVGDRNRTAEDRTACVVSSKEVRNSHRQNPECGTSRRRPYGR